MSQPLFDNVVQIGIVVADADTAVRAYGDLLGLRDWNINYVDTENGRGSNFHTQGKPIAASAKIAWAQIGNVELELIEPRDDDSVYARFLRERGPGVHHVMFATPDYDECVDRMAARGIASLGSGELQQTRFRMFDTAQSLGVICEISAGESLVPDEITNADRHDRSPPYPC
jgi:methylmalonyl-CoA/ethylmalonyl-CoA epimerase